MRGINILNKEGFLSDEDRKEPLEHGGEHFTFKTNLDLTKPIQVIPYGSQKVYPIDWYSTDLANFFTFWQREVLKDLNGFSGFHNVKFELVGFTLQGQEEPRVTDKSEILKIVEKAFDNQISADGWLDYGTPMATLNGKEPFLKEVADNLPENDSSAKASWNKIWNKWLHAKKGKPNLTLNSWLQENYNAPTEKQ